MPTGVEQPVHVLHVDDDEALLELAAEQLSRERAAFHVETALSARTGLDTLQDDSQSVDCIISDYDMADMTGLEFLAEVRALDPQLPFILFTGKGSEGVASEAITAGVTEYLQKDSGTEQFAVLANRIERAVSERRAEKAFEESERMLSTLIMNLEGIVYQCENEPGWPMSYISPSCEELTGYSVEAFTTGTVSWGNDVIHPDDRERVWNRAQAALDSREPFRLEYRIQTADGENRWVWEQGRGVFADGGELISLEGIINDVTEEKRSRLRFQAFIENSSDIVTVLDDEGIIRYQSPSIEQVLGYDPVELIGQPGLDYVHPDDREDVSELFVHIAAESSPSNGRVLYRFEAADGEWRWLESVGSDRESEEVDGYIINSRDVTDRVQREQQLAIQNERLEAILDNVPMILFGLDEDGVFTFSKGSGLALLGLEPGENTGRSVFELYGDDEQIATACRRALDGERVQKTLDHSDYSFDVWYEPVETQEETTVICVAVETSEQTTGGDRDSPLES